MSLIVTPFQIGLRMEGNGVKIILSNFLNSNFNQFGILRNFHDHTYLLAVPSYWAWASLTLKYPLFLFKSHCLKSARIRSFSGPYFPYSDRIRKYTPCLSIFSPNAGKYRPENLRIRTLFNQCRIFFTSFLIDLETNQILSTFLFCKINSSDAVKLLLLIIYIF